ncbi:MAG: HlyD family efflux transporter periplasmic adaptor subunit [Candidatus Abyssobacteria bacterium SURF_5]|uniref:HlyD family efflux transporter periplasmic adaptor subunit n=1 Tax=Abyssobacteria bacterium (strain SURF_5) TaxID=2093360 RepID=A0A3A4NGD1_ABYX5|nr:MAG: HlyD family efflux transporter periplasmic adaptor subunit [Candidatus Abyssubacteria bacterium SURF_5]
MIIHAYKGIIPLALLIPVMTVGYLSFDHWVQRESLPEGLIQANGRIEGDFVTIASKAAGRVQKLMVYEGDSVTAGQVLAQMDDIQVRAKVEQAKQGVAALDAQVRAERTALSKLKKEVPLNIEIAQAALSHAHSVLSEAKAKEERANRDAQRFRQLADEGIADKHSNEQADTAWTIARYEVDSASAALTQAERQLSQTKLGWNQVEAKEQELAALEAQRMRARAVLTEAESIVADMTILAPTSGVITTRMVNVGEVTPAGAPLLIVVDLDHLYLKAYVPEFQIGKLRLGLPARIHTDAFPDKPFEATVQYISSRAEFTPKEVQTSDERVKLVYATKLYLKENPDHSLTPGLPADAIIRWKEGVPWENPRW